MKMNARPKAMAKLRSVRPISFDWPKRDQVIGGRQVQRRHRALEGGPDLRPSRPRSAVLAVKVTWRWRA